MSRFFNNDQHNRWLTDKWINFVFNHLMNTVIFDIIGIKP